MEADRSHETSRYRWAALGLIAAVAILRIVYLAWFCPLDLAPDEAHYWDWSRRLDWCYYSKGPLVAWLIRLSCELFGSLSQDLTGDEMLAVRFPAVVCGSLFLGGLYLLTERVHGSPRLAFAVVALSLTLPLITAGSSLMTIDAPFVCAWMWALVFAHQAAFRGSLWAWAAAGMCIALGVLAKHTMVLFVPSFFLFALATPTCRALLRSRGFWMMACIGALGGLPILYWNATNDWVTLRHTQGHVGVARGVLIRWWGPLAYVGMQFAVLLGFWFVVWVRAMWEHRPTREEKPEIHFLWWMSAATFTFFGLFAFLNGGGEPNWPLTTYLSGTVLAAGWLARELRHASVWRARLAQGSMAFVIVLGLLMIVAVHEPLQAQPILLRLAGPATPQRPMPLRRIDPTCRLRGWRYFAAEVDKVRADLRARGIEHVLAGGRWNQASELAFYCDGHPQVLCFGVAEGDRDSQFDLWRPNPIADESVYYGKTFLLAGADVERLRHAFTSVEPVRVIVYSESDQPVAMWFLAVAHGYRGVSKLAPMANAAK